MRLPGDDSTDASLSQLEILRSEVKELQARLQWLEAIARERQDAIELASSELKTQKDLLDDIRRGKLFRLMGRYWHLRANLRRILNRKIAHGQSRAGGAQSQLADGTPFAARDESGEPQSDVIPTGLYDILVFPIIDWEFRFQRPQQLATRFAHAGHRVFYLRTTFHQTDSAIEVEDIQNNVYGLKLPGPSDLNIYHHRLDEKEQSKQLQALEEFRLRADVRDLVSVVQLPFWGPLAKRARRLWGWRVVYDCVDDHAGFSNNTAEMLQCEEELIRTSDLAVATSRVLHEKLSKRASRTLLLQNATSPEHFENPPPMRATNNLQVPVVGYFGAISDWFDVDLIHLAAVARPTWQFVLIGSTHGADVARIEGLRNVHLLGERPYSELPAHLARFNVACIPFRMTSLTEATNPVKFFEYLSGGKPVVSVDLPELRPFAHYYYVVRHEADFVPQLEAAMREDSPEAHKERQQFARRHTWKDRFETLDKAIREMRSASTDQVI